MQIRKEMFTWGDDVSQMTDGKLNIDVRRAVDLICETGMTVGELGDRLKYAKRMAATYHN